MGKKFLMGLLVGLLAVTMIMAPVFALGGKEDDGVVTLKVHQIGDRPIDFDMVQDELNAYSLEKYGFEIDMVFTGFGDYDQKTQVIINTGEDYDVLFTCSWTKPAYNVHSSNGAFLDLTDYLAMPEFQPIVDAIDPAFWEGAKVNGTIFGVPTQKEIAIMPKYVMYKDLVEESGFDYTQIDDVFDMKNFEPFLQFVKDNHPDIVPMMLVRDHGYRGSYDYPLGFSVALVVDENNQVQFMYDMPDLKEYVMTVRDFYNKSLVNLDATVANSTNKQDIPNGLGTADGQPFAEVIWSNNQGYEVVTHPFSTPLVTTASTRGSLNAINVNTENPEMALKFLQAITVDSEYHNMLNYGLEGIHYEKTGDKHIKTTQRGIDDYKIATFAIGNLFNTYTKDTEPENKWEVFQEENDKALRSSLLGFDPDLSNVSNEIAAMANVFEQYEEVLRSGSVEPVAYMAEFKSKLNEAGLQKVMKDLQAQIDAFLASK